MQNSHGTRPQYPYWIFPSKFVVWIQTYLLYWRDGCGSPSSRNSYLPDSLHWTVGVTRPPGWVSPPLLSTWGRGEWSPRPGWPGRAGCWRRSQQCTQTYSVVSQGRTGNTTRWSSCLTALRKDAKSLAECPLWDTLPLWCQETLNDIYIIPIKVSTNKE